ncbi:MAG: LamG domain-containing protein, partial [Armatimonadota bacterium]|nr:LamG domain-containing protein [Armatimonadota bacterium]
MTNYQNSWQRLRCLSIVLCVTLSLLLSPAHASDPWQGPYTTGTALWPLQVMEAGTTPNSIGGGLPAALTGNVVGDATEKVFGNGSLHFTGGFLSVPALDWTGGDRSLEAFIKVEQYPAAGREATLFSFVDAAGKTVHTVSLTSDGRVRMAFTYDDYLQERSNVQGTVSTPAGSIPKGKWTHIAIHALEYYRMVRLSVDGKILAEENGEMLKGSYRLFVGNNPAGDRPFWGWMQELRQAGETSITPRPTPQTWVDPAKAAPSLDDPKFFPHHKNLLLYAPFDGTTAPAVEMGEKGFTWRKAGTVPRYGPGLHGKALALGSPLDFPGKGNIHPEAGTLSCWVKVAGSAEDMGRIFKLGDSWDFMLSGSHGFYVASRTGRGVVAGDFFGALRNISPGRWHHVALTWQGEWCTNYVDGQKAGDFLIPGGLKPFMDDHTAITIGDAWGQYGKEDRAWLDEYRVYGEPLAPDEVLNLYRAETGEPLVPVTSRSTRFTVYPGQQIVTTLVRQDGLALTPGKGLVMQVVDSKGKIVQQTSDAKLRMNNAELSIRVPPLPAGASYTIKVSQAGGIDDRFVLNEANFPQVVSGSAMSPVSNAAGPDAVLPPWTPIRINGDEINVWDRQIRLDGAGLPQSMDVGGAPLLSGPAFFEVEATDHTTRKLIPTGSAQIHGNAATALCTGALRAGPFNLSIQNETDYDGVSKMTLKLEPGSEPAPIARLTLVIPLVGKEMRFINAKGKAIRENYLIGLLPAAQGRVFASTILPACTVKSDPLKLLADYDRLAELKRSGKEIPKELQDLRTHGPEVTSGSFMPYLWIGSPERGLCWFADDDKGWVRGDTATPAVEVRRVGDRTELRINLVGSPTTIREPREMTFGLLATPVRPLAPDWRRYYWFRDFRILGFGYEFQSGRYYLGKGTPGAYGGEPYPWDLNRAKWFSAIAKKKNWLQVPYFEFTNTYDPITGPMDAEWRQQPVSWRVQGGIVPVRSYADWFCSNIDRYIKDVGIDGLYLDNVCPLPSLNEVSHGAWRDAEGELEGNYDLWNLRTMLQRIRATFLKDGVDHPWLELHMTHSNLIPAMAYANVLLDGEDFYLGPEDTEDFMDRWPLDMLTAIDSPHTWGVPTLFLNHT